MRLEIYPELSPVQRFFGTLLRGVVGQVPGPIQCFSYRKRYFGSYATKVFQAAMRGKSTWSVGERELFAAFVSKKNQCDY